MSHRRNKNEAQAAKLLYEAVESRDTRLIYINLREKRANPNFIIDEYGVSPFHFVIGNDSKKFAFEATKLMLLFGANPNVRSEDGLTPVHIATVWNRTAILHQLLKSGGDPFLRDYENKSAVDYALEGGLTKALQIINFHASQPSLSSIENCSDSSPRYTLTLEKVFLYRDDVRAEFSVQSDPNRPKEQKTNRRQEEVYRHPENWSSSESAHSDVSFTHRITIPPNGNIRIESSVKSDEDSPVRQYAVDDSNIQRTILTYLQDCQVYECVAPGGSTRTPEQGTRSHSSTPNHKTPSAVNFTSLCNNLAKELHEKLKPPQPTSSGFNVSNENPELYRTCLTEPEKSESLIHCHSSPLLEPCLSPQRQQKKCVRNIFIDECNSNYPSRLVNSQNIPLNFAQKSVCGHCEDILCNNFKIVCYHFCDSQPAMDRDGTVCACSAKPEKSRDPKFGCSNSQKSLIGFERIERNGRPQLIPSLSSSLNEVEHPSAPPLESTQHQREVMDCCDKSDKASSSHCVTSSPTNSKKPKLKPSSSFLKNRAKLEKAFLKCIWKSPGNESQKKEETVSQVKVTNLSSSTKHSNSANSKGTETRGILKEVENDTKKVNGGALQEYSDATTIFRSMASNGSHQSLNVQILPQDESKKQSAPDLSSPKKCNICDYQDESNEVEPHISPSCDSHSCSGTKNNRFSLPVSASPVKLDNCVELHFFPTETNPIQSEEGKNKQPILAPDHLNKSSSTFETVIKALSNDSLSSVNKTPPDIPQNLGSVESLTNITDMPISPQDNSPENSSKLCLDKVEEVDAINCLDVAFCLSTDVDNDQPMKGEPGVQSDGRTSHLSVRSDAFFSSSERGSLDRKRVSDQNPKNDEAGGRESSSDYFSPHELTRSYWTSDEDPSFLQPVAQKSEGEVLAWKRCGEKDECGFDATGITSDDEPDSTGEPKFNVCEEYKYVDEEKDIVFRETRFKSSTVRLSALTGFENLSVTENNRKTHELSDEESSGTVSSVSSLTYDTDTLRLELKQKGYVPGPITFTTKRLYLRKLKRIRRRKAEVAANPGNSGQSPDSFSHEADRTINQPDEKEWQNLLQSWAHLETKMSSYFETPTRHAKWRGGISKCSFTYLLLDPRITENLPVRSQNMSTLAVWSSFLRAIFYVGKGKRSRPYSHLYEAVKFWNDGTSSNNEKIQHILNLWKSNHGVICLNVFQNIMPVEALTREAAMIEALGLKNLKNEKHGEYYGPCASWSAKQKCQLGCFLLYRALIVFLADGERQLKPYDVE